MKNLRGYLTAAIFAGVTYALAQYGQKFSALVDMVYPYVIRTLEQTLAQWSSQVDFLVWQLLAVALLVVAVAALVVVIVTKKSFIQWFGWALAAAMPMRMAPPRLMSSVCRGNAPRCKAGMRPTA